MRPLLLLSALLTVACGTPADQAAQDSGLAWEGHCRSLDTYAEGACLAWWGSSALGPSAEEECAVLGGEWGLGACPAEGATATCEVDLEAQVGSPVGEAWTAYGRAGGAELASLCARRGGLLTSG